MSAILNTNPNTPRRSPDIDRSTPTATTSSTATLTTFSLSSFSLNTTTLTKKYQSVVQGEEEYHLKHLTLALKLGAPLVECCGDDFTIHQCEAAQEGIEFDKMQDIDDIHRDVTEGRMGHDLGLHRLRAVEARKELYSTPTRIIAYGIACVAIGLYAFDAQPKDLFPIFVLGCLLAWMQLFLTPRSRGFSDLFPFLAAALLTVVSLGLGSIHHHGVPLFCWTAIAEGTVAIILPAYTMLVATSEVLSNRSVCGTARLAKTIFYTMMLSLGMGCAIFTLSNAIVLQARWKQIPGMVLVAVAFVLISFWLNLKVGLSSPALLMVASFFAGLLAQNYGSWTNNRVIIVLTPTLFFSIPGGLLARESGGVHLSVGKGLLIDLATVLAVLESSVGVWVGLKLAALVHSPREKQRHCICGKVV
ncbi:hypothetical protein A1O1_03724 [Capronia coronata CBS 617.96]|uniref:Threonine/serine exporter-like N-terminal domain-containing protein n=1 Tax=Capronia coronata CBS 617.96 TaxID=1182541 RepID=W9YN06_9EURO|nr:uncharacterized protein A1O1_03724 [Capronia coronata CBS 617.96]EXJ90621.1 hypothetical protein A1O1_03724 [Capronia coronata CBS 617.96]